MVGGIIIAVVLIVVIPVGVLISGAFAAFLIGSALNQNGQREHADSELLQTNY